MISEASKNFRAWLHERVTNPFFGALIISWCCWNWRVIYVTLFIDGAELNETKIQYIENVSNPYYIYVWPIVSAIIIVTVLPYLTNLIYKAYLTHRTQRVKVQMDAEKKEPISEERAAKLLRRIHEQELEFARTLDRKDEEIKQKNEIIDEFSKRLTGLSGEMEEEIQKRLSESLEQEKNSLLANANEEFKKQINAEKDAIKSNFDLEKKHMKEAHDKEKNDMVKHYNSELMTLETSLKSVTNERDSLNRKLEAIRGGEDKEEFEVILNKEGVKSALPFILDSIAKSGELYPNQSNKDIFWQTVNYLYSCNILDKGIENHEYSLTEKGRKFARYFYDQT